VHSGRSALVHTAAVVRLARVMLSSLNVGIVCTAT
jgi:hypothetical protein